MLVLVSLVQYAVESCDPSKNADSMSGGLSAGAGGMSPPALAGASAEEGYLFGLTEDGAEGDTIQSLLDL